MRMRGKQRKRECRRSNLEYGVDVDPPHIPYSTFDIHSLQRSRIFLTPPFPSVHCPLLLCFPANTRRIRLGFGRLRRVLRVCVSHPLFLFWPPRWPGKEPESGQSAQCGLIDSTAVAVIHNIVVYRGNENDECRKSPSALGGSERPLSRVSTSCSRSWQVDST